MAEMPAAQGAPASDSTDPARESCPIAGLVRTFVPVGLRNCSTTQPPGVYGTCGLHKTALQLVASACSHVGHVRAANQDAYGYSVDAQCFVVCDGMGGAAGGEVASRITVETFLERLTMEGNGSVPRRIEQAVCAANRILHTRAQRESGLHGMGTTMVALVLGDDRAWIAHVGDSRCYLLREGTLIRCTEDHSLVEEQVRLGRMSPEEALESPLRHVITRAIGVHKAVSVEMRELPVQPGDLFLLCSDGLTRELEEASIGEVLAEQADQQTPTYAERLVAAALRAGGADNVTCLTVQIR